MTQPLTLEDFNANFTVRVVDYKELSNNIHKVVFEVRCKVNNRVGVFISDVDTTLLNEGFTHDDVVNAGWDEVKTSANEWGVTMISKVPFTVYTPESVADNSSITLLEFNNNFTVSMSRFELYPSTSPSSWCIGFYIQQTSKPAVSMYVDGNVPIGDYCNNVLCKTVAGAVWDNVKANVCSWASTQLAKVSVIDTSYTPTTV